MCQAFEAEHRFVLSLEQQEKGGLSWAGVDRAVELKREGAALTAVIKELRRATKKHGPMRSGHEGYAILKEEVDELWDAVKVNDLEHAAREAIQVAAMAIRFVMDVGP